MGDIILESKPAEFPSSSRLTSRCGGSLTNCAYGAFGVDSAESRLEGFPSPVFRSARYPVLWQLVQPFFIGKFPNRMGALFLSAGLRCHVYKVFMFVWFGFCALWTLLLLSRLYIGTSEAWWFPFAGIG